DPYTQAQVLEYWRVCDAMVDGAVDALDLESPESGFSWYSMSKLEHQFVNVRHIQHHAAQLCDRLRSAADIGIRWVGGGRREGLRGGGSSQVAARGEARRANDRSAISKSMTAADLRMERRPTPRSQAVARCPPPPTRR